MTHFSLPFFGLSAIRVDSCGARGSRAHVLVVSEAREPRAPQEWRSAVLRKHAVEITINGEPKTIPDGLSVAGLLELLGKQPRYLAVERNKELVPRTHHAECPLHSGDQIEIVTLVGGG